MPPILIPSSIKCIATRILVTAKLHERQKSCFGKLCFWYDLSQQAITFSKLATEAQEQGVKTIQNQERRHKNNVNVIFLLFLLLTVNIFQAMF